MNYQETDSKLSALVDRHLQGATLIDWQQVSEGDENHYIVLWCHLKPMGENTRREFGTHRALIGVSGSSAGLSDLQSGTYNFDLDTAVKHFKRRAGK